MSPLAALPRKEKISNGGLVLHEIHAVAGGRPSARQMQRAHEGAETGAASGLSAGGDWHRRAETTDGLGDEPVWLIINHKKQFVLTYDGRADAAYVQRGLFRDSSREF